MLFILIWKYCCLLSVNLYAMINWEKKFLWQFKCIIVVVILFLLPRWYNQILLTFSKRQCFWVCRLHIFMQGYDRTFSNFISSSYRSSLLHIYLNTNLKTGLVVFLSRVVEKILFFFCFSALVVFYKILV